MLSVGGNMFVQTWTA